MAKLIFETNNGQQQEISLSTIKTKNLSSDDIIALDCEIGQVPPREANIYMTQVRDFLQAYFPQNKIIVFGMRNGKKDIELKIIKDKE
ncbi:MAG TPA: hypothetical protein P5277_05185 [Candidatus Paceibacterota bacterium]|nr:hypothetical protein [Candidatus Paceibacterota bacterium]